MRKLIYAINISIDGYADHFNFFPDEEIMQYFVNLVGGADTFLYGRKTYELMVPYWPDVAKNPSDDDRAIDIEYAHVFNAVEKMVVISASLENVDYKNATVINTNLHDEVLKLKQQPGKDILTGGITLPSKLAELGLIDEYRFVIHPGIVGRGRKLFEGISLPEKLQLKFVDSTVFKSGVVVMRYIV